MLFSFRIFINDTNSFHGLSRNTKHLTLNEFKNLFHHRKKIPHQLHLEAIYPHNESHQ